MGSLERGNPYRVKTAGQGPEAPQEVLEGRPAPAATMAVLIPMDGRSSVRKREGPPKR